MGTRLNEIYPVFPFPTKDSIPHPPTVYIYPLKKNPNFPSMIGKNILSSLSVEEKNDGGTISISGIYIYAFERKYKGEREGEERVVAIYNANGNSHKYSGRGFNGLRYIPDTYAGNDACMQPVERRGEIIFFFRSFLPHVFSVSGIRIGRRLPFLPPLFFNPAAASFPLRFGQF